MAVWVRRIEGVFELLDSYPEQEANVGVLARRVADIFRTDCAYERGRNRLDLEFTDAVDRLADCADEAEFNDILQEIYDWADDARVWIEPVPKRQHA